MTIPEVEHAALVSGDADIVLLVRAHDIAALRELVLNSFQSMPEVLSTQTVLIFDQLGRDPAGRAAYRCRRACAGDSTQSAMKRRKPPAVPPSQTRWSNASVSSVTWRGTT